jgi:hypothetical protein
MVRKNVIRGGFANAEVAQSSSAAAKKIRDFMVTRPILLNASITHQRRCRM